MEESPVNKIFARADPPGFVGRPAQIVKLLRMAAGNSGSRGIVLLSAPTAGASELLRQAYDHLFSEQKDVIPFYFEVRSSDRTAQNAALRFLCEFLLQTVAFRRRDAGIIAASPAISEIAELAAPSDGHWIDRLVDAYKVGDKLTSERLFVRNCLSAPIRAAVNDARPFVMIDDLHLLPGLEGGEQFLEDVVDILARSLIPFVLSGLRRFMFARTPFETMAVEPFSFSEAGRFIEGLSASSGVLINDQSRDLMAVQLGGNAGHITSLFYSAAAGSNGLNSFEHVEQAYTDEIFGGRICRHLDAVFDHVLPETGVQTNVLRLLSETLSSAEGKLPLEYWHKHTGLSESETDALLDTLNYYEIISLGSGVVEIDLANLVLCDYLGGRSRLELDGNARALVVGETLSQNVKRAPVLMARYYRRRSAIGLRALMRSFDGRQISPALIDYGRFKEILKGAPDQEILKTLDSDPAKINLPQIVYAAHTAAFYPRLNEICDAERSAVALGFADPAEKDDAVWIAVEIDSKLEVARELAEFWCDRLEMVAIHCNFKEFKLWLVSPEGFAADAMEVLSERNAYGSSRKQIDLLAGILKPVSAAMDEKSADEYEIVVPMGEDTEMIAAHAVEEVAKRHNFPAKAINQIKTALVEACINAAEHSLSPDRKIYQKFVIDKEKIVVTVANRGLRLADRTAREVTPAAGRRGWGLKLMKGLMDDVKIEQTDDGTRITMVKFLKAKNVMAAI